MRQKKVYKFDIPSKRGKSNLEFEGSFVNFGQKLQELYQFKEKIHFQKNAKMHKKVAIKFKRGDWPCPPRSPDLAIYDFFLRRYLKHSIWNVPMNNQPKKLRELRNAI